jgi:biotin synthase-related radical SAM superfamily protein
MVPDTIRVSIGTASVLGLAECWLDEKPTTAYLMTHTEGSCIANCSFCPQARESPSRKQLLSRVLWPAFSTERVLDGFRNPKSDVLERICIQAVNYPGFLEDVVALLEAFKDISDLPVSLDSPPLYRMEMERLKETGLDRIGLPLDAATAELFDKVKGRGVGGPYRWERHMESLEEAIGLFGVGGVITNLIVGLGETEEEVITLIQRLKDMGVQTALFAFTPIPGTAFSRLPQPPLESYRRVQLARYLITKGMARCDEMEFDEKGRITDFSGDPDEVKEILLTGEAFRTSGCPGCNRPYYNERPSGPLYNYPRGLSREEAVREAELVGLMKDE